MRKITLFIILIYYRHLGANPFVCDCRLSWLAEYLTANPIETSGARCQYPAKLSHKSFTKMKSESMKCKFKEKTFCYM